MGECGIIDLDFIISMQPETISETGFDGREYFVTTAEMAKNPVMNVLMHPGLNWDRDLMFAQSAKIVISSKDAIATSAFSK